ncbi:JHBP domain containing protein, partial [Asbolus verrucosus]
MTDCLEASQTPSPASNFKKCDRKSNDFNQCLMTAVQGAIKQLENPIPELGLPSLEPVRDPHLIVAPGSNIFHIEQNYENFDSYGFSTANVSKF